MCGEPTASIHTMYDASPAESFPCGASRARCIQGAEAPSAAAVAAQRASQATMCAHSAKRKRTVQLAVQATRRYL